MVALVTDVHYRMSPALIRALGKSGVTVYTCDREQYKYLPGARSKYTAHHAALPDDDFDNGLYELLIRLGKQHGCRPALLPMGAATLQMIAADKERFSKAAGLCVSDISVIDRLNSKEKLAELAVSLSVPVPQYTDGVPCVVKPLCGEKFGLHAAERYKICKTPAQRAEALGHFERITGEAPVVQEYLSGGGSGISVIAENGELAAWIGHRRIREYPVSGGPSSCCVSVNSPELLSYVRELVSTVGLSGPAMFEFKDGADGKPRILECNPRIWGSFPLTYAAESSIAFTWFALAWNSANEKKVKISENSFKSGKRMVFFPSDLAAAAGYLKTKKSGNALRAALDFINPTVSDGVFTVSDPAPAVEYYKSLFVRGGDV